MPCTRDGNFVELRDYLRIIRRRWLLILGCLAATIAVAVVITIRTTPQYSSSARVFISTSPSTSQEAYQGSLFSEQRVSSYADLMTGLELAQRVVEKLQLDLTAEELAKKIEASVVPDTVLLKISVTDPSPATAQRINEALVGELADFVAELETPPGSKTPLLKATVVDPARLPATPVSPQPVRNIGLAAVLGLLLGFGLAVLREMLDTTLKAPEEITRIAASPLMAGIGYDKDTQKTPLVTSLISHAPRAEAFRVLRTNLQFIDVDSVSKAYVVTSSVPGEGKSTTATNVALTMAQNGQRVVLVDCDLRRPQVADMLGLENVVGVTTVLLGNIGVDDALQNHPTGLKILASGAVPPNPAELLQSRAMADLLAELRTQFDVIIIDSPPLLPVTDAALLASQTDGALLVVRHGRTTRDQLHGSHERLEAVGARALGVVFNMVPKRRSMGSGYGYGYGYGYAPVDPDTATATGSKHGKRSRDDEDLDHLSEPDWDREVEVAAATDSRSAGRRTGTRSRKGTQEKRRRQRANRY